MAKRILIYEPSASGHHFKYVQLLIRAFSGQGREIFLASKGESFDSIEYTTLLKEYEHLFTKVLIDCSQVRNIYLMSLLHSWNLLKIAKRYNYDLVFIPYLDIYLYTLGFLLRLYPPPKGRSFEGIIFRGDCSYDGLPKRRRNRIRRYVMQMILASQVFHRVLFIDELIYESFLKSVPQANGRMALCPDPVETDYTTGRDEFRRRFAIPREAKAVGVFGLIDSRKGVDRLLRAFDASWRAPSHHLFLMGNHSEKVRECVRNSALGSQIISVDRFVTDDEMVSGINAVDVVAAVYPRHVGSASIVIRAAAAGKPVLGSDFGWIGHMIRKHGLGKVCNVRNGGSLVEGFRWAFNNPMCDVEEANAFAKQNSVDYFIDVVRGGSGQKANI